MASDVPGTNMASPALSKPLSVILIAFFEASHSSLTALLLKNGRME